MAKWEDLVNHVMSVREGVYEGVTNGGYNNITQFGAQYGENGVSWCVIFDWCMYSDVGQAGVVPKTDNVDSFTSWAKSRGQWSQYPSIGAWVNFNNGEHTELVVGFDATNVYTKGGNTNNNGSAQGDGVYSHTNLRTAAKITGYFAPRFSDGVCPPTADPSDPRGGTAVTAWRYGSSAPAPTPAPVPAPTPTPTPQEDDMAQVQLTVGADGGGVTFARGAFNNVAFFADNTLFGKPAAKLRVVVWDDWGADIHDLTVDNSQGQRMVVFRRPSMTHSITVTRSDSGGFPVYGEVSHS